MNKAQKDSSVDSAVASGSTKGPLWKRVLGYILIILWSLAFLGFLLGPKEKTNDDYKNLLITFLIIFVPGILLLRKRRKTPGIHSAPSGPSVASVGPGPGEPADEFFALLKLAKGNPVKADFTRLRQAFTRSRSYNPMKRINKPAFDALQSVEEGRTQEAVMKVENCLGQYFLDMDAHLAAAIIYRKTGDLPRSNFHHQFFRGLMEAIMKTGDGRSFDTAYRIIDIPEEYTMLNSLKLRRTARKTQTYNDYLYDVIAATNENGVEQQVYFRMEYSKVSQRQASASDLKTSEGMPVVKIGNREWMARNVNVTQFRNGDPIPEVKSEEEWIKCGLERKPAWCYLENNVAFDNEFGKLYNWYAVSDPRGILPEGWRLPVESDWTNLADALGGRGAAGHSLKSMEGWSNNSNGNNASGFNARPSGSRLFEGAESFLAGTFTPPGQIASWWSADERGKDTAGVFSVVFMATGISRLDLRKEAGASIRGVRP